MLIDVGRLGNAIESGNYAKKLYHFTNTGNEVTRTQLLNMKLSVD